MKQYIIFLLLGAMIGLLAACGGGAPAAPEPVTFDVTGNDSFEYNPPSLSVPTGAQVTINFENEGTLEHNWLLIPGSADPEAAVEGDAVGGATTGLVAGGATDSVTFTAPPMGIYQYVCTVPGHAAGGMVGEFTVLSN